MHQGFVPIKKKKTYFDDDYAPVRSGKKKKDNHRQNRQVKASNKYGDSPSAGNFDSDYDDYDD